MIKKHASQPLSRGFLLVTTLWILTAITLALSYFALWLDRSVQDIETFKADTQAEIDMLSTRSTLLYWFSTQSFYQSYLPLPANSTLGADMDVSALSEEDLMAQLLDPNFMSNDGLSQNNNKDSGVYVYVDNRAYQGLGATLFSVQDASGLLPLRGVNWQQTRRLIMNLGIDSADTQPLLDKFQDYVDLDEFSRLNGAEAYQYQEQDLLPPTNRLLRTTAEVQAIMDWRIPDDPEQKPKITPDQHLRWQQLTTITAARGYPNFNTAPREVLQSIIGIDHEGAERIIKARTREFLLSTRELYLLLGNDLGLDHEYVFFRPSHHLRFSLWSAQSRKIQQWHISFTPGLEDQAPFELHYRLDLPQAEKTQAPERLETPLLP